MNTNMNISFKDLRFDDKWVIYNDKGGSYRSGVVPEKVLFSELSGTWDTEDIIKLAPVLETTYKEGLFAGKEFIRIADYSKLNSNISVKSRKTYAHLINQLNDRYNCHPSVTYICGASLFIRSSFKIFASFVRQKFVFVESVDEAFVQINKEKNIFVQHEITYDDIIFNDEWIYENSEIGYNFVIGIIPGKLLYLKGTGRGEIEDAHKIIEEYFPIIFRNNNFENSHINVIWEIIDSNGLSYKIRKYIFSSIKSLQKQYSTTIKNMYICGEKGLLYNIIKLFSKGLQFNILFVDTVEDALNQISQETQFIDDSSNKTFNVKPVHIKEINTLLCTLLMTDDENYSKNTTISPDNPLLPLKETIDVARSDFNELRNNEREMNLSIRRHLSLITATLESTVDGILVTNNEGKAVLWNKNFTKMWNLSDNILSTNDEEKFLNAVLSQLSNPYKFLEKVKAIYDDPEAKIIDILDLKDGRIFKHYSQPQRIDDEIVGRIWSFHDTTDQKKSEKKVKEKIKKLRNTELATMNIMEDMKETVENLKKAKKEIADKNEELKFKTEELQAINQELNVAHEQLTDLNNNLEIKVKERTEEVHRLIQLKDEFINQLSHDLKTPITPLNTLLPLIQKRNNDNQVNEMLTVCIDKVRYMKALVKDTLELARINSSNFDIQLFDINLPVEIQRIVRSGCFNFEEQNIDLAINIPENIIVKADKVRFEELINNIVSNAVKFSPNGGRITIKAEEIDDNLIRIGVSDTGIGITKEQIEHIFDEFYKADESRHDFTSTGLGLSICKKIIEKHEGTIWVESDGLGTGSTFYFTLHQSQLEEINKKGKLEEKLEK